MVQRLRQSPRGFSLIELGIVAAITAIVAALAVSAFTKFKQTANYGTSVGALVTALDRTRMESLGRGSRTVFVLDTVKGRWWSLEDLGTPFTLDGFVPDTGVVAPDVLIAQGTLPATTTFGPANGWNAALPAPFSGFPTTTALGATYPYCSFCSTSGNNPGFGAVAFYPGDGARFAAGPTAALGQVFTLQDKTGTRLTAVALVARTGLVQVFTR